MSRFQMEDYAEDDYYLTRMRDILEGYPKLGPLQHPSKLLEHVYIGNQDNADNLDLLQALEITHVLNCAGTRTFDLTRSPYRKDTGIVGFLMMPAEDYEEFDIMQYFMDAIIFLDKARTAGGRALVHCNIGVNRSGAIAAAYLMIHQRRPLLKVIEDLKSKRSLILQNVGFRRQLIRFARCRGLLDLPERPPKKPNFNYAAYSSRGVNSSSNSSWAKETPSVAAAAASLEKPETVRNGNSNSELEETAKETATETANSETTNGEQQTSTVATTEASAEEKPSAAATAAESPQSGPVDDSLPSNSSNNGHVGKFSGYETELGTAEEKGERSARNIPRMEVPNMDSIRDDVDKAFTKLSQLDLGSSRRSAKSSNRPVSPVNLPSTGSTDLEYPRHGHGASPQSLTGEPLYPTFRLSGADRVLGGGPDPSFTQRLSRESSSSDASSGLYASLDDDDRKYASLLRPSSSSSYLDDDEETPRSYVPRPSKSLSSSDRFVSSVKPRSYYQHLASLNSSSRQQVDDEDDDYDDALINLYARPTSRKFQQPSYGSRNGMLFVPFLAKSHHHQRPASARPLSFADRAFTTDGASSYPGNSPYNRMSLSDLDSLGSGDFPLRPSTGFHSSYRPSATSFHRGAGDYDNAVDEYSDLLDASIGRSNALGAAAKGSRASRSSAGSSRKFYRY